MKVTLESTTKIVEIDGVPARVWEGRTEAGVACFAFITRIAPSTPYPELTDAMRQEFDADLAEQRPPSFPASNWPSRVNL